MVYASIKSREKVFHLPHCKIHTRINRDYRIAFDTPDQARAAGYRMCNCCSSMGLRLRKEQKTIDAFCEKNKLKYLLWDGDLMIKAPNSDWKIIINGRDKKMFLYHKNKFRSPSDDESMIPGYHSQAVRQKTILGYLQYIVSHDDFRQKQTQSRERSRNSKRDLRRNTNHIQRGKTNRKYSANQLYSILDSLSL